jgi:hypothetical protein
VQEKLPRSRPSYDRNDSVQGIDCAAYLEPQRKIPQNLAEQRIFKSLEMA